MRGRFKVKVRNIILLAAMAVEFILFLYCLLRKSNHVPAGYICAVLSFVLLIWHRLAFVVSKDNSD